MRILQISNASAGRALLYFDGFGGSEKRAAALPIPKDFAVFFVYDYTNEEFALPLTGYSELHLSAWSLGVWQAARTLVGVKLASAVALNGTLDPIDDAFGIPSAIFDATLENWSEAARVKFNRRIGLTPEFASDRPAELEAAELAALRSRINGAAKVANIYETAVVGTRDRIFSAENQIASWRQRGLFPVEIDSPHYAWDRIESAVAYG